jgi:hypothetical protein
MRSRVVIHRYLVRENDRGARATQSSPIQLACLSATALPLLGRFRDEGASTPPPGAPVPDITSRRHSG